MKNLKTVAIAIAALVLTVVSVNSYGQDFKQKGGENNLQVMFAPLGGSPISIGGIAYRKFSTDGTHAMRLNFFLGFNSKTDVIGQPADSVAGNAKLGKLPELDRKQSGMTFAIRPGYEWHYAGTEHLSPYWGVEANFSMTTASVDSDFVARNGSNTTPATAWSVYTGSTKGKGANTTIGLNAVAGFDYYFAKSFSIGAEIGFGLSMVSMPDVTNTSLEYDSNGGARISSAKTSKQGSSFQLGPNAIGQFKLGWLF